MDMAERADKDLAFMLRYENVAWYDGEVVRILDRRVYPTKTEYVTCRSYVEVADAIRDMVTQSGGPYLAAAMGMALAAKEGAGKKGEEFIAHMEKAASVLSHARPTTMQRMIDITSGCLEAAAAAIVQGEKVDEAVFTEALHTVNARYAKTALAAKYLVDKIPDDGTVMTQCFAETIIGMMLKECRARGKTISVICAETRPYFQGARLTASVVKDMGFDVTVITDNMAAYTLKAKKVDVFTSAADVICMDGHIVNKVGTFQIALGASYWGVPYYVTGTPNPKHPTIDTVHIEERDGEEVLSAMGVRTAMAGVKGFYPAFDITPPKLCDGVVTDKGIYPPCDVARYWEKA